MPFKKGQSGNVRGRPKSDFVISDLAKEKTKAALACLVEVMENDDAPAAARVSAAQALLDRGWGKPPQAIHATGAVSGFGSLLQKIRAAAKKP